LISEGVLGFEWRRGDLFGAVFLGKFSTFVVVVDPVGIGVLLLDIGGGGLTLLTHGNVPENIILK
jgi:hypothetical protein